MQSPHSLPTPFPPPRRRKPIAYRSPSVGSDDSTDLLPVSLPPSQLHHSPSHPTVKLIVMPPKPPSPSINAAQSIIPPIRIPPHKDWYKMKILPRAPMNIYHPLRVPKRPPPRPMSTTLPQRRPSPSSNNASAEQNAFGTRTSSRSRRAPYKVREGDSPGSSEEKDAKNAPVQEDPPKKQRRPRRKKAEILAAALLAAAEEGVTIAPRRKRKQRGAVVAADGAAEDEKEEELQVLEVPVRKRRRRNVPKDDVVEGEEGTGDLELPALSQDSKPATSAYGTRSRSKRSTNESDAGAEEMSVDGEAAAPIGSTTVSPNATPKKRGKKLTEVSTSSAPTPASSIIRVEEPEALANDTGNQIQEPEPSN